MNMTVGNILSGTWAMMRQRFWLLLGMYFAWLAIMMAMVIVLGMVMGGSALAFAGSMEDPDALAGGLSGGFMALMVLFYLGYILVACAQYGALCALASPLREGDFGSAFQSGVRAAPSLLAVIVLGLVAYFGGAMLVGLLAGAAAMLGTAAAVIVALLVIPVMLYFGARLGIVLPVVPVDGVRNPFRAIGRAWSLTRGNALPIFLSFVVFMLVMAVVLAALMVPMFGSIAAMDDPNAAPPIGAIVFFGIGIMVVSVVIAIAYGALLSTIHGQLAGGEDSAGVFE